MAIDVETQIRRDVGARIRRYRKARDISQTMLARDIGTRQIEISMWENGHRRPNGAHLERIADALGVHWRTLAYGDGAEACE
jgi:transcriptional regulator with XRE-family HTH domain